MLNLQHAFKIIITLGAIAFISLRSIFGSKSSYGNFSVIAELMADIMNEAINTGRLADLSKTSSYIDYYDLPSILSNDIPFATAPTLLFPIPTYNGATVDLCIDDYINICLHRVTNGVHEATKCFNIITNTFDLFYKRVIGNMPNKLKRSYALSLRKLRGERSLAESKKILG